MSKIKEKITEIIGKGNEEIKEINKSIERFKETPIYTKEHKLEIVKEKQQEILNIRNKVNEEVRNVFDVEIERLNKENSYIDHNPGETANVLKMIELSKENMSESEIKHLFNIYSSNNIVRRVLMAIADKKEIYIDGFENVPNIKKLESMKESFSNAITSTGTDGIESLKLELLYKSI